VGLQKEMFERPCDKVVLGLDLSLTGTGGAIIEPNGVVAVAFTAGYKLEKDATVKQRINRLIDIWMAIWRQAFTRRRDLRFPIPRMVGIEGYAYAAQGRGKDVAELHGLVKVMLVSQAHMDPDDIHIVAPAAVKKEVFGHGSLDKKEIKTVVDTLRRDGVIQGAMLENHNERDAWAIAQYVRRRHG